MTEEKKRWTVVHQYADESSIFCHGVFKQYNTALGDVMDDIFDFKTNYEDEGDIFEIGCPYELEGEGGEGIDVAYKKHHWNGEAKVSHYYLLEVYGDDE